MTRGIIAGAVMLCLATPLGGTAAGSDRTGSDLTVPDGLALSVRTPRLLATAGLIAVRVENQTGEPVLVTSLAVRSGLFDDVAAEDENVLVYDGRVIDIPVAYGSARCPADDETTAVEVTIQVGDGPERHGLAPAEAERLRRLHERECGERYVTARVDITFADDFEDTGDAVAVDLVFTRQSGDETVEIDATRGSVNFDVAPHDQATVDREGGLATLPPERHSVAVPVSIAVVRCEPHAMFESKKMFDFHVWVTVGDVEEQAVMIRPTGALRELLQRKILECARAFVAAEAPPPTTTGSENGA